MNLICILIVAVSCFSCKGQENNRKIIENEKETKAIFYTRSIDTLSVLNLEGKQYGNVRYQLLKLYNIDNDLTSIEIVKNQDSLNTINLPSSEDVKNFSVSKIVQTNDGFKILANWGGGNNFYKREFDFLYKDGEFYFSNIVKEHYVQDVNKEIRTIEKISPLISLSKFDISLYIENK